MDHTAKDDRHEITEDVADAQDEAVDMPASASTCASCCWPMTLVMGTSPASFQQPSQTAATQELKRQLAWTAAVAANLVSGYIQDGKVTITASTALDAPITGTTAADVFGGQRSGWKTLAAAQTVELNPDDPSNTAAPAISGTASVAAR